MTVVYGVDLNQEITPIMVREALVECFADAHCKDAGLSDIVVSREYCKDAVTRAFEKLGFDYNFPTRDSLLKVVEYLADFSKSFRNQEIIEKHKAEIIQLVNKLN